MEYYGWKEDYSVKVESLDLQHRKMFEIFHKLGQSCDAPAEFGAISDILSELHKYAQEHFEHEERLLQQHIPDLLEEQRKQHRYYVKRVEKLTLNVINKKGNAIADMHAFVSTWWLKHILKWDMKYKGQLTQQDLHTSTTPAQNTP
jgi:hemerythrin